MTWLLGKFAGPILPYLLVAFVVVLGGMWARVLWLDHRVTAVTKERDAARDEVAGALAANASLREAVVSQRSAIDDLKAQSVRASALAAAWLAAADASAKLAVPRVQVLTKYRDMPAPVGDAAECKRLQQMIDEARKP